MPRTLWCILLLALFPTFGVADEILFSTGPDQQRFDSNGEGLPSFGTAGTSSYSVTDKFILRSTSAITGIGFSAWVDHGTTPVSLAWQITSAPGNGIIAEGDASLTNTPEGANICGCDVYWSTFSTSDVVWGWAPIGYCSRTGLRPCRGAFIAISVHPFNSTTAIRS